MSLTFAEMQALCAEIQPQVTGTEFINCVESGGPKHFDFILKGKDTQYHLLVCLQEPFLRFHLMNNPAAEHSSHAFTHQINKHLCGSMLHKMELWNDDRILKLTFHKNHHPFFFIAELFPKSSNAYLLDNKMHILASLREGFEGDYHVPEKHHTNQKPLSETISSVNIETLYFKLERQALFDQEKQSWHREINSRLNRAQRLKINCEKELAACLGWKNLQHEGLLIQSRLYEIKQGMQEISIPDWENENKTITIRLDPNLSPQEEIETRFKKSKKLRAGVTPSKDMVKKAERDITLYTDLLRQLEEINDIAKLVQFQKKIGIKKRAEVEVSAAEAKALPYREFYTAAGLKIWVGKSAKNNEDLTFRYANGSDWWLHVREYPGSHVIIKGKKQDEPDQESILDAAQLALYYSKAKDQGNADVCLTQCKYVTRFGKGHIGKVQISKHRVIHARTDPDRLIQLKSRKPA